MSSREVEIRCPNCGSVFAVPRSTQGGVVNCPHCDRMVPVPGGFEALFWLAVCGGVLAVLLATGLAYLAGGATAATVVFAIGALIFTAALLAS